MKAGESERRTCNGCMQEFEVILEPKAVTLPLQERPKDTAEIQFCPFCGDLSEEE